MTEKTNVLVLGGGYNYIKYLQQLNEYRDLITITVFNKVDGYEDLFSNFNVTPPSAHSQESINNIDCCFLTPGNPLAVKATVLKAGMQECQIFTELESFLLYIKSPSEMRNMGSTNFNKLFLAADTLPVGESLDRSVVNALNYLESYALTNKNRPICAKWPHYFEIYDRHFAKFRNTDVTVVEIGVFNGGSVQMWKNYFGSNARIIGIDIDPRCKAFEEDGIEIMIGSQEDRGFLQEAAKKLTRIDVLIDDGGHTMNQQITTFEELFPLIAENGVYLCEDLHTSYWEEGYDGGYKKPNTFIEYSKNFIDYINAWHFAELSQDIPAQNFKCSAHSLHYYDSVLVVEKRKMYEPLALNF